MSIELAKGKDTKAFTHSLILTKGNTFQISLTIFILIEYRRWLVFKPRKMTIECVPDRITANYYYFKSWLYSF